MPIKVDAAASGSRSSTPLRTYGSNRSFKEAEIKHIPSTKIPLDGAQTSQMEGVENTNSRITRSARECLPVTPVKQKIVSRADTDEEVLLQSQSTRTSHHRSSPPTLSPTAIATTPTTMKARKLAEGVQATRSSPVKRTTSRTPARPKTGESQIADEAKSSESDEDETTSPPCRHRVPVFADRFFYNYRDPRAVREWEICEMNMKMMAERYGNPLVGASA